MSVEHIEVLVEEPSAEAALQVLLPKILDDVSFCIYPFQCKDELLKLLPDRLRCYANWLPENWRIVVLLDRDDDDCRKLKNDLDAVAQRFGLRSKSSSSHGQRQVLNRIVVEELEAWYFGDWDAVKAAYKRVPDSIPQKSPYRVPDAVSGGTWEAFERILKRAGYFKSGLRKIEVARTVAAQMDPVRNTSRSFQAFLKSLR